jgi:hypothetical protein
MYEGIIREAASDRKWIRHRPDETLPEEGTITGESKRKDCVRRNWSQVKDERKIGK